MKLSNHAKIKLEIYGVDGNAVIRECTKPVYEFYDATEETNIKIIKLYETVFAVVLDETMQTIITVYTTDDKTIKNRNKNKRWILI